MLEHEKHMIFLIRWHFIIMNQLKHLIKNLVKNLSRWSKPNQINYNKFSLNQMNDISLKMWTNNNFNSKIINIGSLNLNMGA
jgi:hypothetical protein